MVTATVREVLSVSVALTLMRSSSFGYVKGASLANAYWAPPSRPSSFVGWLWRADARRPSGIRPHSHRPRRGRG